MSMCCNRRNAEVVELADTPACSEPEHSVRRSSQNLILYMPHKQGLSDNAFSDSLGNGCGDSFRLVINEFFNGDV